MLRLSQLLVACAVAAPALHWGGMLLAPALGPALAPICGSGSRWPAWLASSPLLLAVATHGVHLAAMVAAATAWRCFRSRK